MTWRKWHKTSQRFAQLGNYAGRMLHQNKENHIHAVKRVALRHSTSKSNTNTQYIIGYYSPSTNKDAQSNKIEAQEE